MALRTIYASHKAWMVADPGHWKVPQNTVTSVILGQTLGRGTIVRCMDLLEIP